MRMMSQHDRAPSASLQAHARARSGCWTRRDAIRTARWRRRRRRRRGRAHAGTPRCTVVLRSCGLFKIPALPRAAAPPGSTGNRSVKARRVLGRGVPSSRDARHAAAHRLQGLLQGARRDSRLRHDRCGFSCYAVRITAHTMASSDAASVAALRAQLMHCTSGRSGATRPACAARQRPARAPPSGAARRSGQRARARAQPSTHRDALQARFVGLLRAAGAGQLALQAVGPADRQLHVHAVPRHALWEGERAEVRLAWRRRRASARQARRARTRVRCARPCLEHVQARPRGERRKLEREALRAHRECLGCGARARPSARKRRLGAAPPARLGHELVVSGRHGQAQAGHVGDARAKLERAGVNLRACAASQARQRRRRVHQGAAAPRCSATQPSPSCRWAPDPAAPRTPATWRGPQQQR
jgi:hypothetical protein